jgi:hypothetical protein
MAHKMCTYIAFYHKITYFYSFYSCKLPQKPYVLGWQRALKDPNLLYFHSVYENFTYFWCKMISVFEPQKSHFFLFLQLVVANYDPNLCFLLKPYKIVN